MVIAGMENYLDKSDDLQVEIEPLELLMDPEDSEVCLRYIPEALREGGVKKLLRAGMVPGRTWGVHAVGIAPTVYPDACKKERQQDFRNFQYKRETGPLSGKQKPLVGVPRKEGGAAREVAKRFARRELRRNDGKGSSVPRKKDEDAAAAAEFFVDKGGRKRVECSRKDGSCIAGESLEGKSRN